MIKHTFFYLAFITLVGCDCLQSVSGTVADETTSDPIEGAIVSKKDEPNIVDKTDANGRFELSDITGPRSCDQITVVVEKSGFATKTVEIQNEDEVTILLSN